MGYGYRDASRNVNTDTDTRRDKNTYIERYTDVDIDTGIDTGMGYGSGYDEGSRRGRVEEPGYGYGQQQQESSLGFSVLVAACRGIDVTQERIVRKYTEVRTPTPAPTPAYIHTRIHACMHTCMHAYTHATISPYCVRCAGVPGPRRGPPRRQPRPSVRSASRHLGGPLLLLSTPLLHHVRHRGQGTWSHQLAGCHGAVGGEGGQRGGTVGWGGVGWGGGATSGEETRVENPIRVGFVSA